MAKLEKFSLQKLTVFHGCVSPHREIDKPFGQRCLYLYSPTLWNITGKELSCFLHFLHRTVVILLQFIVWCDAAPITDQFPTSLPGVSINVASTVRLKQSAMLAATNLTAGTVYEVAVWAHTSIGDSPTALSHYQTRGTQPERPLLKAKALNQTAVECSISIDSAPLVHCVSFSVSLTCLFLWLPLSLSLSLYISLCLYFYLAIYLSLSINLSFSFFLPVLV